LRKNHYKIFFSFINIQNSSCTNSINLFTPFLVTYTTTNKDTYCVNGYRTKNRLIRCWQMSVRAHFYVYIHSSTNWWLLSVETHIHMCIYAYLRVCVYLFSTVNCILVIQEYEHSIFIFRCRCRHILTKKYLVKFIGLCIYVCVYLLFFFFLDIFALGKNF
jgi:hypothetical protein